MQNNLASAGGSLQINNSEIKISKCFFGFNSAIKNAGVLFLSIDANSTS